MRIVFTIFFFALSVAVLSQTSKFANTTSSVPRDITQVGGVNEVERTGDFYLYWGWNISAYTASTITFSGDNYHFSLADVEAKNRPSPLDVKTYLSPVRFTIPQYNFRVGYFFNNTYNLSFGIDHMKYVMVAYQESTIDGYINTGEPDFDGAYEQEPLPITPAFLQFEHTDGLNYVNFELRRIDQLLKSSRTSINLVTGIGTGLIIPRSNVTLMHFDRFDEWNIAGFGVAAMGGLHFELLNRLFIQLEAKAGYINLPNIRTTHNKADRAKQDFCFLQTNVVLGVKLID